LIIKKNLNQKSGGKMTIDDLLNENEETIYKKDK
jgi:hypothetical protein